MLAQSVILIPGDAGSNNTKIELSEGANLYNVEADKCIWEYDYLMTAEEFTTKFSTGMRLVSFKKKEDAKKNFFNARGK